MRNENQEILLDKLKSKIELLQDRLPKEIFLNHHKVIDSARAEVFREACLYRITELVEAVYDAFLQNKLVTAFILCRAFMETEALFCVFVDKLEESLKMRAIDDIREFLSKSLAGVNDKQIKTLKWTEKDSADFNSHKVLSLIQHREKKIKGYSFLYASFCEVTHPNAAGTVDAYVKLDLQVGTATFGRDKGKLSPDLALSPLVISLEAFIDIYDHSADLLNDFVFLCEEFSTQAKIAVSLMRK